MQLVAYGAQDVYLTGNPQITFFKVVYRRHTNFSMESIEQTFNGTVACGNKVTATISRNGDLVHKMYVEMGVTAGAGAAVKNIGHAAIAEVEVEIGGQRIDKHYSQWLDIWADLTVPAGKTNGYDSMIGSEGATTVAGTQLFVPLQFWFCRNPGLALPLIALQYHEVKINITFETDTKLGEVDVAKVKSASLWVDYIYLDTDERRRFAQVSHEYLIEQLQFTGSEDPATTSHRLNFNHPVKELVWVHNSSVVVGDWNVHTGITKAKLQLNGHDRMAERIGKYFSHVQPYQHHTNVPVDAAATGNGNINVYSFALKPEDHQPSGTCNMSRIDNATLSVTAGSTTGSLYIFAVNYNVLRIMGGMGGLAYSN